MTLGHASMALETFSSTFSLLVELFGDWEWILNLIFPQLLDSCIKTVTFAKTVLYYFLYGD